MSRMLGLLLMVMLAAPLQGQDAPLEVVVYRSWLPPNITVVEGVFRIDPAVVGAACEYRAQVTVKDSVGTTLTADEWNGRCPRSAGSATAGLETIEFALVPASYTLEITVDGTAAGGGRASVRRELHAFAEPPLASDLILAREVAFVDTASAREWPLRRGEIGLDIASRTVAGPEDWDLDYYIELYPPAGRALTVSVSGIVRREDGRELARVPLRQLEQVEQAVPVAGKMSVAGLPAGAYTFELALAGADTLIVRQHAFDVAQSTPDVTASRSSAYLSSLTDQELETLFGPIEILLQPGDADLYRSLSPAGKRNFLAQQFGNDDPADERSSLGAFLARSRHVTRQFAEAAGRSGGIPAWQTDRGRIWMLRGEPTSQTRKLTPRAGSPYEIWVYAGQANQSYLFADETRLGNYRLIYTTDPTLPTVANWTRRIGPEAIEDLNRLGVRVTAPDRN